MDDLISRQAAIDEAKEWIDAVYFEENDKRERKAIECFIGSLKNIPSAHPERKKGKWIITKTERGWNCAEYPTEVTCSNCNYIEDYQKALDFCPNCGADMRGGDAE